nr:immunoglobulin heavy chain junction region [Macaca mulatta]MOW98565.1 immunoglobulin heavy chain junction region [Macaca mulatta]MOW98835.1 immunoglobulin heavy chain junction region [Macaca mulatta]MOW99174.1 immunoglobulin heavy chain junction region [Macaca mulatta]MOW99579.1 immunoglobulin heavy chain junction region [Macaca mulatta]
CARARGVLLFYFDSW